VAVTVRLDPDMERVLESRARAAGVSLESYVETLLNDLISNPPENPNLKGQELESELDGLAAYSDRIPLLPLTVLTREGMYQDHD
jgi:hypothetical protein